MSDEKTFNDGGLAFPCTPPDSNPNAYLTFPSGSGMSLRDYFAGQVIGHLAVHAMRENWASRGREWRDDVAYEAYKFAESMLEYK
jgi:hypothetical protein